MLLDEVQVACRTMHAMNNAATVETGLHGCGGKAGALAVINDHYAEGGTTSTTELVVCIVLHNRLNLPAKLLATQLWEVTVESRLGRGGPST